MNIINLSQRFKEEICTFEMAKRVAQAGMTCANTFLSYDEHGDIGDGAWLENITGVKMYPCVNFVLACAMIENTTIDFSKAQFLESTDPSDKAKFKFVYDNAQMYGAANLVDLILEVWINHKKDA